jgi:hypothetical protein
MRTRTGSKSCPVAGLGIDGVESSRPVTSVRNDGSLVCHLGCTVASSFNFKKTNADFVHRLHRIHTYINYLILLFVPACYNSVTCCFEINTTRLFIQLRDFDTDKLLRTQCVTYYGILVERTEVAAGPQQNAHRDDNKSPGYRN